ncbi:MAG: polysaccharide deacetylase family protein [Gemmatimonadetes bacterium]|nr:polysaccharide deacetylase family protein [Gemmatimonadota bacterium]
MTSRADQYVVLCYHDVEPRTRAAGGGPTRFSTPTAMFERMLDTILEQGYRGCSLAEARVRPGTRRVAITFDDANRGQYEQAVPALRARDMSATIYVCTEWIGRPGFMSWDDLRAARDAGMSIQSHTRSHPFLSELGEQALRQELTESKARLDRELGKETHEIAFPGGDAPQRRLRSLIWDCGYTTAVGTRWGLNADDADPRLFVRRCTVRGNISVADAKRFINADPLLGVSNRARESVLRNLRSFMGASRYERVRRRFLNLVDRS